MHHKINNSQLINYVPEFINKPFTKNFVPYFVYYIIIFSDAATAETMYEDLLNLYPDHLVIHSAYLQVLDPLDKRSLPNPKKPIPSADSLTKVIGVCNKLLESINEDSVLAYIATKTDLRSDANKIKT